MACNGLISALNVTYNPQYYPKPTDAPSTGQGCVWYTDPETKAHGYQQIDDGTVYVMNDAGATVARYYLANPPTPVQT